MPVKIFFCYAHEDESLLNKLKTHLRPLQRQGLIDVWHDRDISAGTEWEPAIKTQLNTAQIILLLVSPDFMDSDYCYSIEMKRAIERHEQGGARVIPVILRHIYWQGVLGKLQALPTDGKPVTDRKWHTEDEAFHNVEEGIRKVVEELTRVPDPHLPVTPTQPPKPEANNPSVPPVQPSKPETKQPSGNVLQPEPAKPLPLVKSEEFSLLKTLEGHSDIVCSVAFSPDGHTLASGCADKTIKLWNPQTGKLLRTLKGHSFEVYSVAFSPDGQMLASGSRDKTIKLWGMK